MAYVPPAPSQLKKTEEGIIVYITVQPNLYPGATTAFKKKTTTNIISWLNKMWYIHTRNYYIIQH